MSKRTPGLPQRPRGFCETPPEAIAPLVPYLPKRARYGEPCAGSGKMIEGLARYWPGGSCVWATDLAPQADGMAQMDAVTITAEQAVGVDLWVTNPPWPVCGKRGDPAMRIIEHLITIAPAWALLPHDVLANDYFGRVYPFCAEFLPIGRVSWMGNGKPGKDNATWYRFDATNRQRPAMIRRGMA